MLLTLFLIIFVSRNSTADTSSLCCTYDIKKSFFLPKLSSPNSPPLFFWVSSAFCIHFLLLLFIFFSLHQVSCFRLSCSSSNPLSFVHYFRFLVHFLTPPFIAFIFHLFIHFFFNLNWILFYSMYIFLLLLFLLALIYSSTLTCTVQCSTWRKPLVTQSFSMVHFSKYKSSPHSRMGVFFTRFGHSHSVVILLIIIIIIFYRL